MSLVDTIQTIIAGVALCTFVFTVYTWKTKTEEERKKTEEERQKIEEERTRVWQTRVIYKMLLDKNGAIVPFDGIRQDYLNSAQQLGKTDVEVLKDDEIYDALLRLLEKKLIFRDSSNAYGVCQTNSQQVNLTSSLIQDQLVTMYNVKQATVALPKLLKTRPDGIDVDMAKTILQRENAGLSDQDFDGAVHNLTVSKVIIEDGSTLKLSKQGFESVDSASHVGN